MANTYGYALRKCKEPEVWTLFGKVTIGATGAPTLSGIQSKGITSITRNSAGKYTIVLNDSWNKLLSYNVKIMLASGAPAAPFVHLVSETVATLAAKNIVIQFLGADASTATDPDSGTTLFLTFELKNSSVA